MTDADLPLVGVDLFCGGGGFSQGWSKACEDVGQESVWLAINHWQPAIETHERNHPEAVQYHSKIEQLHPPRALQEGLADHDQYPIDDPDDVPIHVDVLLAGPECTHFSTARGGKPVSEQKRMSPWQVLDWLEKLQVEHFLMENVKEFCFPDDSMVLTEEGPVPIQDVEVGTRVLTHKGRWKPVTAKTARTKDTVSVTGNSNRFVRCTPDHEFYARPISPDCWGGKRGRHVQELGDPTWTDAASLDPDTETSYEDVYDGYYWATPTDFGTADLTLPDVPRTGRNPETVPAENLSTDFWRMVGLWLGDGWLDHRPDRDGGPHRIRIAGGDPQLREYLTAVEWLTWNEQPRENPDVIVYEANGTHLAHWLQEHFGENAHGKTIPAWVLSLPEDHRRALVEGYHHADGSKDTSGRYNATTTSKRLALGLKFVLESLDIAASLPAPRTLDDPDHRTLYNVTWDETLRHADNDLTVADETHRWTRVTEVEPDAIEERVWDLTVADDHSFVVDGVVAHNCNWGPVEDGEPTCDGTVFDAWVNALNKLGYSVNWTVLNAADFGDPTSRDRFFIQGSTDGSATFPEPTHSPPDAEDDKPDHRTAGEIIDWTDRGTSIWTRDITEPLVTSPPKDTTMQRIAEGIRRHCDDRLDPYADVLEQLGRPEIRALREERVVSYEDAGTVAAAIDEPFLVELPAGATGKESAYVLGQQSNYRPWDVTERPTPTVTTGGKHQLCSVEAMVLRQGKGAHPITPATPVPSTPTGGGHQLATIECRSLIRPKNGSQGDQYSNRLYPPAAEPHHTVLTDPRSMLATPTLLRFSHGGRALSFDDPMPTIATERGGVFALSQPYLTPLYNGRPGQRPRTRSVNRPLMTVVASKPSPAGLAVPYLVDYHGESTTAPVDEPVGALEKKDRYALCVPELWPWGLDIKYRMLQPEELKQAQGFPADYEIVGTKEEKTEQIGNAVPVHLARALCRHLLTESNPDLGTYGGGFTADSDYEVPDYSEVVSDD